MLEVIWGEKFVMLLRTETNFYYSIQCCNYKQKNTDLAQQLNKGLTKISHFLCMMITSLKNKNQNL